MSNKKRDPKVMDFWEHLEELRWVLFKSVLVLAVTTAAGFYFTDSFFSLLMRPLTGMEDTVSMIYTSPAEAFFIKFKMAFVLGGAVAAPCIIYFIWTFVAPGLKQRERDAAWAVGGAGTLFFCGGVAFGYFLLFLMLPILVSFATPGVRQMWHLSEYIGFCIRLLLGIGLAFELPVVLTVLVRAGLLSSATLKRGRSYAVVGAFVVAAVVTPSPDAITQIALGVPLVLLYEISIWGGVWQERRRRLAENEPEPSADEPHDDQDDDEGHPDDEPPVSG